MRLGFAVGDFDQILVAEPGRVRHDWLGNRDVIVPGELLHHIERRVADRPEPGAELGDGRALDLADQTSKDAVKQFDLLFVEPIRGADKQIGDTPHRVDAFIRGAAFDRVLQLGNKRLSAIHDVHPGHAALRSVGRTSFTQLAMRISATGACLWY